MTVAPSLPQPGIFIEETALHYHLEFSIRSSAGTAVVAEQMARALQAATSLRGPNTVWGFNPDLWRSLAPGTIPDVVQPFAGIVGSTGVDAPSTQSDIWFWCHGNAYEKVWRTAYDVMTALAPIASLDTQLSAFVGRDNRDPIGFIDGTENPALDEALEISVLPEYESGAGGVPILVQKWVHKLPEFEALPVPEQEGVIGRTLAESIQLSDAVMPPTSHVSRNTITDDAGEEMHIYRRNTPYAQMGELGTMFIGCSADPGRIDTMLARMFGTSGDGLTDRLIEFSTPVTGSYYFAPAMAELTRVFGPLAPDEGDEDGSAEDASDDGTAGTAGSDASDHGARTAGAGGTLGIGSLRG